MHYRKRLLPLGVFALAIAPGSALADMGRAPAKPGEVYLSGEGGYMLQDGGDVNAYGVSEVPGTYFDRNVSAEDGWFAGGQIGYENGTPFVSFLPFTRLEGYVYGGETDASRSDTAPPLSDISLKSVDGNAIAIGGSQATATTDRQTVEFGYRSEFDQVVDSATTITWGYVSFIRDSEENTDVTCSTECAVRRSANVDTWMFGSMLMMEPEYRITPGVALVGRLGAGFYFWDAEGKFNSSADAVPSSPFNARVNNDDDGWGFRGALGASLKFILAPGAFLETFAEADYFSDVGVAKFSNADPNDGSPSRVDSEDMWELRTGARLTIGLAN